MGHEPVLLREALVALNIKKGGKYVDTTVGLGGHAQTICQAGGRVLGIDWDRQALEMARQRLSACPDAVLVLENFTKLAQVCQKYGFVPADGVLFDLGVSSLQLEMPGRGFSFQRDEPLDMRMNPEQQNVTAADLLNVLSEKQLNELFAKTTAQNLARAVARAVSGARRAQPIKTTGQLAEICEKLGGRRRKIHPATTIFLALRLTVNSELKNLQEALPQALEILGPAGRLVVISFHSGEDRLVKQFLRENEKAGKLRILTKKPTRPKTSEISQNPRARSAKLRLAEKL